MKNLSIPALAILIAITFIAQPVVVSVAQYGDGATVGDMIGSRLYNLRGQDLGRIDCVTFDDDGRPAFIILSVYGTKIVPIPFSALQPSSRWDPFVKWNRFVVNITKDQLRRAPGYSINAGYAC